MAIIGALINLQNNTIADATQVMANFNTIVNAVNNNAAKNGVNQDIIQLSALTTPITPAQGGTSAYIATAPSTGSANAQVIAATLPALSLVPGINVQFTPGFTNTGAMTLSLAGVGTFPVVRRTPVGIVPLAGGEVVAGSQAVVVFDGSQLQLMFDISATVPPGAVFYTAAPSAPLGYLLLQGQAVSRALYTTLFTLLGSGTVYGFGDGSTTFNLPDGRGRFFVGPDAGMNRINLLPGGGALGNVGGAQLLGQSALPNAGLKLAGTGPDAGSLSLSVTAPPTGGGGAPAPAAAVNLAHSAQLVATVPGAVSAFQAAGYANIDIAGTTGSMNGGVTQTYALPPTIVLNPMIKY